MDKQNIHINRDLCIGCGSCPAVALDTFAMGDDNIAYVREEIGDDDETIVSARDLCPTMAIILDS